MVQFGRIDAEQTNLNFLDNYRVAINHIGSAFQNALTLLRFCALRVERPGLFLSAPLRR